MNVTFKPTPETERAYADLDRLFRALVRPRAADMRRVADAVRAGFAENFEREAAGDFGHWDPLAESTVEERIALGFPGERPILVRTGDYLRSWTDAGAPDHVEELTFEASGFRLDVGSADNRVEVLEEGNDFVPARPVSLLSQRAEQRIGDALDDLFDRLLGF